MDGEDLGGGEDLDGEDLDGEDSGGVDLGQSNTNISNQNGATSGFEMCFGPGTQGAGAKTRPESSIKK